MLAKICNILSINQNFPWALLTTSYNTGGLNISTSYNLQGIEKLSILTVHLQIKSILGKLFLISIKTTHLEIVMFSPFWIQNYDAMHSCVTLTWITTMWDWAYKNNIEINATTLTPNPHCINNIELTLTVALLLS